MVIIRGNAANASLFVVPFVDGHRTPSTTERGTWNRPLVPIYRVIPNCFGTKNGTEF